MTETVHDKHAEFYGDFSTEALERVAEFGMTSCHASER